MFKNKFLKKEDGNAIDLIGSLWVLLFMVAILLIYGAYAKGVQVRLNCDTIAKKYLYKMEANGYLNENDVIAIEEDFDKIGVRIVDMKDTTITPVPYGGIVTLSLKLSFKNPVSDVINGHGWLFDLVISPNVEYFVYMEATAKW